MNAKLTIYFNGPQDPDDLGYARSMILTCNDPIIMYHSDIIEITSTNINLRYRRDTVDRLIVVSI